MAAKTDISSSLSVHWQLMPYGYAVQYDFETALTADTLRRVIEIMLREVLPEPSRTNESITDFHGRDPQRMIDVAAPRPRREELFYIAGERTVAEEKSEDSEETGAEQFEAALYTSFLKFDGPKHIVYTVQRYQNGLDDEKPNLLELAIDPHTKHYAFRMGLEFFESRLFSVLGFAPSVTQTLLIECTPQKFLLRIVGDSMKARDMLPLQQLGTFQKLGAALQKLFNFNLEEDYRKKI